MKRILSILVLFVLCLSLCACADESTEKIIYDDFNQMAQVSYTSYSIEIKRTADDESLRGMYNFHTENGISKIEYSYEVLNPIEEVDGVLIIPNEYKSIKKGFITVQNGKIIEKNGESLNIDTTNINGIAFKFDETYFENESVNDNSYSAKVKNVDEFFGTHVDCDAMNIEIDYLETRFEKIVISFMSNAASIEISYLFS